MHMKRNIRIKYSCIHINITETLEVLYHFHLMWQIINLQTRKAKNCHYSSKWLSALTYFSFTENSQVVIPGCIAHSELSPAVCHNNVLRSPGKQCAGWLWNGLSCEFVSVCLLFLWSVTYCLLCGKIETLVYEMQMLAQYRKVQASGV